MYVMSLQQHEVFLGNQAQHAAAGVLFHVNKLT
jgi:hypothetical protein